MTDREHAVFDDDELETWSALATLLEWLPAALDSQLVSEADLTHFEYGILFALGSTESGALRMSVLAGHANSTLSRLSRAISRLETRGWVHRQSDPADGRATLAVLTQAGSQRLALATPGHVALVRSLVLDPLTRAQRDQLLVISRRITAAIRDEPGWTQSRIGIARS